MFEGEVCIFIFVFLFLYFISSIQVHTRMPKSFPSVIFFFKNVVL